MEAEIISMSISLLRPRGDPCGILTSGGTESILIAILGQWRVFPGWSSVGLLEGLLEGLSHIEIILIAMLGRQYKVMDSYNNP